MRTLEHLPHEKLLKADFTGALLSFACVIHCAAAPLLLSVLALVGLDFLLGEKVETLFLASAIILALVTHWCGFKVHRRQFIFIGLLSGMTLIILGKFVIEGHFEVIFVVLGGTILSISHFINRYFCKTCPQCQHDSAQHC